jgi:hypothetical protein
MIKQIRMGWDGRDIQRASVRTHVRARVWLESLKGKSALERPRQIWDVNVEMKVEEARLVDVDWIHLAQDKDRWRAVSRSMNLWDFLD